ncbi:MAG: non-ribosomal peptide synthetase [Prochlorococcaceae cyanobacterium]
MALAEVAVPCPRLSSSFSGPSRTPRAAFFGAAPGVTQRCTASELLKAAAMARPSAPAIRANGKLLKHGELDIRINQMSRALLENGVKPGTLTAICLDRSLESFILLLACARAGTAAVPLDNTYPIDRLARILEVVKPTYVVTNPGAFDLPLVAQVDALAYRDLSELAVRQVETPPSVRPSLADPAYVLLTSGSRGVPKPVTISHGCLSSYLGAISRRITLTSEDVFLHTASLAFSAAVRQLWLPLVQGACLEVADDEARRSPQRILELIQTRKISAWDTVPSILKAVLDYIETAHLSGQSKAVADSLMSIYLTGEPLEWQTVRALQRIAGTRISIHNLYSQTETGGTISTFNIASDQVSDSGIVPLGQPLDDVAIDILDADHSRLLHGEPGEIAVTGTRFEDKTHLKQEIKAQSIRTGDLGILHSNGVLETLGRVDDLIKLRGFRVHLGDVESALMTHPLVSKAVVLADQDGHLGTEHKLVAYWVSKAKGKATTEELQAFVRTHLPDYMIPAAFVELEVLPLTINGKVDRNALPPASFSGIKQTRVAPKTQLQSKLHAIWTEVLGHHDFGVTDNFFEIGGHSLTATRIISRIESTFGKAPPLAFFFQNPNITALEQRLLAIPK